MFMARKNLKKCRKGGMEALQLTATRDQDGKTSGKGEEEYLATIEHQEVTDCKQDLEELTSATTEELELLTATRREPNKDMCTVYYNKQVCI